MKFVWFVMYETLLLSIRNYFKQSKRTNAELFDKLHGIFESNNAEFKKLKRMYGDERPPLVLDLIIYEHYEIEKLKKRKYGDNYEIKPCEYE